MKVLLATDGSPGARKAAEFLARLPGVKEQAWITVLHVVEPVREYTYVGGVPLPLQVPDPDDPEVRARAAPALDAAIQALGGPDPGRLETRLVVGAAAPAIIDFANKGQYDLVVMGSRGLSLLKELLLGSVSLQVLHGAHCPVLVVR